MMGTSAQGPKSNVIHADGDNTGSFNDMVRQWYCFIALIPVVLRAVYDLGSSSIVLVQNTSNFTSMR